jgi:preprotein translocase subunit SecD
VRSLSWLLAIVVMLGALLGAGTLFWGWKMAPQLGLDLQGGTEIILTPQSTNGQAITSDELNQAVSIIRQRVDATGVSESEISTQGVNNIVVSIPGTPDAATLQRIKASAKLDFRAVICASNTSTPSAACTPTSPSATPTPGATATPAPALSDTPATKPSNGSDEAWVTPKVLNTYSNFKCSTLTSVDTNLAPTNKPLVTCDDAGTTIFVLGPVEVDGATISDASAGTITSSQGVSTGQWAVNLTFNGTGTSDFAKISNRIVSLTARSSRRPAWMPRSPTARRRSAAASRKPRRHRSPIN